MHPHHRDQRPKDCSCLAQEHRSSPRDVERRQILTGGLGIFALLSMGGLNVRCLAGKDGANSGSDRLTASGRPVMPDVEDARPAIFWIEAGVCTGCSCSLLDSVEPSIESVFPELRLEFQSTLMDASGSAAIDRLLGLCADLENRYVLVVDGAIASSPMDEMTIVGRTSSGQDLSAQELVSRLAEHATSVLALGTCACFGGIPAARPNPSNSQPLAHFVPAGTRIVRVPGCPPHPGWILEVLTSAVGNASSSLTLDELGRPLPTFGQSVHERCPRKPAYDAGQFATRPGDPSACMFSVGCRGKTTLADCPSRPWNGRSFCIDVNHPCIGCTSPSFPDESETAGGDGRVSPFYYDT